MGLTVEVGAALLTIRDSRLYRQNYATFEDYCRERWGIKHSRAYQLMDAAGVMRNLSTIVEVLPANEAQVRPLAQLAPNEQREVWQEAVETAPNGKVTAAHIQQVIETRQNGHNHTMAVMTSSASPEWHIFPALQDKAWRASRGARFWFGPTVSPVTQRQRATTERKTPRPKTSYLRK
jgi:hypothetical protein